LALVAVGLFSCFEMLFNIFSMTLNGTKIQKREDVVQTKRS